MNFILASLIQEFGRIGAFSILASSGFLVITGAFTYLFYHEFFIGERPKQWLIFSIGLIVTGVLLPLNYFVLTSEGILKVIFASTQLIGPIITFIGSLIIFESSFKVI